MPSTIEIVDKANLAGAFKTSTFENQAATIAQATALGLVATPYNPDGEFMGYVLTQPGDPVGVYYIYGPSGDPVFMEDDVADEVVAVLKDAGLD